jgi:hypothetical protein
VEGPSQKATLFLGDGVPIAAGVVIARRAELTTGEWSWARAST